MDAKKSPVCQEAAQVLLERHGKAHSFRLLFLLKNSLLYQWENERLGFQDKKIALSANWFLDSVAETLILEVFGEKV